jgi:hypothetical protein
MTLNRKVDIAIVTMLAIAFLHFLRACNYSHLGPHFLNQQIEGILASLPFFLPLICLVMLPYCSAKPSLKVVLGVILLPIAGISFIFSFLASNGETSPVAIKQLPLKHTILEASKTNGGAATDYGIVIEEQYRQIPGIKWIKKTYVEYPAYDVEMKAIDANHVECIFTGTRDDKPKKVILEVN